MTKKKDITLNQFKLESAKHEICDGYAQRWNMCRNRKELIDLCLHVQGADYVCNAIAQGWGISPTILCKEFNPFINGKYLSRVDGRLYTSELFCQYIGAISLRSTFLMIIDSDITIVSDTTQLYFSLYVVGKCRIKLKGQSKVSVNIYGKKEDVVIIRDNCIVDIKECFDKERL